MHIVKKRKEKAKKKSSSPFQQLKVMKMHCLVYLG